MKKLITLSLALLVVSMSYGQINGIDFSKAIKNSNEKNGWENLIVCGSGYAIMYHSTPVGIKHCWDKMTTIMADNGLTMENAYKKEIMYASYVDNLLDYENLHLSLSTGSGEVIILWIKNGYMVGIILSENSPSIIFSKVE